MHEWWRDFWTAILETNIVGMTPYGPRSQSYWLVKMVSTTVFVALMLVLLYYSLK